MNSLYNQNYTREEIEVLLHKIQSCISAGRYTISLKENHSDNIAFIQEYHLSSEEQKTILMDITVDDFCYSLQNTDNGYEDESLYVFVSRVRLLNCKGKPEIVDIYIQFNIVELSSGSMAIVVLFHKSNESVKYLFRKDLKERGDES